MTPDDEILGVAGIRFDGERLVVLFLMGDGRLEPLHWDVASLRASLAGSSEADVRRAALQ